MEECIYSNQEYKKETMDDMISKYSKIYELQFKNMILSEQVQDIEEYIEDVDNLYKPNLEDEYDNESGSYNEADPDNKGFEYLINEMALENPIFEKVEIKQSIKNLVELSQLIEIIKDTENDKIIEELENKKDEMINAFDCVDKDKIEEISLKSSNALIFDYNSLKEKYIKLNERSISKKYIDLSDFEQAKINAKNHDTESLQRNETEISKKIELAYKQNEINHEECLKYSKACNEVYDYWINVSEKNIEANEEEDKKIDQLNTANDEVDNQKFDDNKDKMFVDNEGEDKAVMIEKILERLNQE